jgi:3-dehydroquinate dehydratase type I
LSQPRICIPVVATDNDGAAKSLARIQSLGYLAELRLDYLDRPDLPGLLQSPRGPVIVTNRLPEEGGRWLGPERDRQRLLEEALTLGADYVDVEFNTDPGWRRDILAARGEGKIILSWHDFQGTSTPYRLADTMLAMTELGADIIKMVVRAHHPADCLALLALIPASLERGQNIIAFSMGPTGKYSRVIAPLLGGYLTFAVLEPGQESAPGQLSVRELLSVWETLTSM